MNAMKESRLLCGSASVIAMVGRSTVRRSPAPTARDRVPAYDEGDVVAVGCSGESGPRATTKPGPNARGHMPTTSFAKRGRRSRAQTRSKRSQRERVGETERDDHEALQGNRGSQRSLRQCTAT